MIDSIPPSHDAPPGHSPGPLPGPTPGSTSVPIALSPLRYVRITARFWMAAIATEAEYRLNFVMSIVSSLMGMAGSLYLLFRLFKSPDATLAGWTWPEALLVTAIFTILDGLQAIFLAPNRMQVSSFVREGTLDFVLLKPIDSQYWVSVRLVSLWGVPRIVMGLILLFYAGAHTAPPLGATDYLLGVLPIALSFVALYSLGSILSTLCIWFVKLYNITIAMQSLLEAGRYPIHAYPGVYRAVFTFILPVAFLTTVPAQAMLGQDNFESWLLGSAVVALGLFWFSRWFWRFALRSYTSASS